MKIQLRFVFSLCVAGLLSTGNAFAQCTLDQNQPQWNGGTSERNLPGYYDWQSFTAGVTGVLCEVDVMFCNSNTQLSGTGTLNIYSGVGNGGTLLTTQTVTVNGTAYNLNTPFWQVFSINAPPAIVSGQSYTWEFVPTQSGGLPDPYLIQVNIPDVYAGGVSYNFGTGGDITFRTYADMSTGMKPLQPANAISLFPNPAENFVNVLVNASVIGEVYAICDLTGRIVQSGQLTAENSVIDVSGLTDGVYFLRAGDQRAIQLVKQ